MTLEEIKVRLAENPKMTRKERKVLWNNLLRQPKKVKAQPFTKEEGRELFQKYPRDGDYMVAYEIEDEKKWLPVLERYGVVVLRAFSEDRCDATVRSLFDEMNCMQRPCARVSELKKSDPLTWVDENWPSKRRFLTADVLIYICLNMCVSAPTTYIRSRF